MTGSLERQPHSACSTQMATAGGSNGSGGRSGGTVPAAADACVAQEAAAQGTARAAAGVPGASGSNGRVWEPTAGRPHSTPASRTPASTGGGGGGGSGGLSPAAPAAGHSISTGGGDDPLAAAPLHVLHTDQAAFCLAAIAQLAMWLSLLKRSETLSQKLQPLMVLALELAGLGASLAWPLRYWRHRWVCPPSTALRMPWNCGWIRLAGWHIWRLSP